MRVVVAPEGFRQSEVEHLDPSFGRDLDVGWRLVPASGSPRIPGLLHPVPALDPARWSVSMLILGRHRVTGRLLSQIAITGYAALDGIFHHATYEIQGTRRRRPAQPAVRAAPRI